MKMASQPNNKEIKTRITVVVEPDRADWTYQVNAEAGIKIYVLKNNVRWKPLKHGYWKNYMYPTKNDSSIK
jgi:hypothetical protein